MPGKEPRHAVRSLRILPGTVGPGGGTCGAAQECVSCGVRESEIIIFLFYHGQITLRELCPTASNADIDSVQHNSRSVIRPISSAACKQW
jgi:hypothetical protein